MNERTKLLLSLLLLSLALSLFFVVSQSKHDTPKSIALVANPHVRLQQLANHWQSLPMNKKQKAMFDAELNKNLIFCFVYKLSDCGNCLAKTNELLSYIFSLKSEKDFGLLSIAMTNDHQMLNRYLSAMPQPGIILRELLSSKNSEFRYGATPIMMVIDRRDGLKMYQSIITATPISEAYFNWLNRLINSAI